MPGRSKRGERKQRLREEARLVREQSERQVTVSVWDRNPIKQHVRRFGWLEVIRDYAERRRAAGVDRPLKYLTIPGTNASDVRFLGQAGLLFRDADGFPDVVICDRDNADKALEVLGTVRGVSRQSLDKAMRKELPPYFPFDVINLDICGAVITGHIDRRQALRTLTAIRRIFWFQRGQGFLLLLTTSTDDRSARRYLEGVFWQNLNEDNFPEAYLDRYKVLDLSPFQRDYRTFVGLVLPKVIGRMARNCGYKIIERFAAKYNSKGGHRMLCCSFECEPLGGRDPAKKYEPRFKSARWDKLDELNEQLSNRARTLASIAYGDFIPDLVRRELLDIADILRANPELETELTGEAESLIR